MPDQNKCSEQEEILESLRKLYRRDFNNRSKISEYANKFKLQGVFLRSEIDFLQKLFLFHKINFDISKMPAKLLTVELVPSSCWFSNVRNHVPKKTWDFLRKSTYKTANYKCEVCGGRGNKWPVECHEIWDYDDHSLVQKLSKLTALCPNCHQVKHIGFAAMQGLGEQAEAHLSRINDWSIDQTDNYLNTVCDTWKQRSRNNWTLDLSFLKQYNIHIDSKHWRKRE